MNIQEFCELSVGKWSSQRTVHDFTTGSLQAGRSDLYIDSLSGTDSRVNQLLEKSGLNAPEKSVLAFSLKWTGTFDQNPVDGEGILVFLPHTDHPQEGEILQVSSGKAHYTMGNNDVLTIITETPNFYAEEKVWYLSQNLRVRSSVIKGEHGFSQASFRSEIRMGNPPEIAGTIANAQAL